MTSALPSRVSDLREKLGRLKALSSKAAEASDLSDLRNDLSEPVQTLQGLAERQALFESLGVPVTAPESLEKLRRRAESIREKFTADRTAAALKRGQSWKIMLTEAAIATTDMEKSLNQAWRDHRANLFAGETPAKIAGVLAGTKANNDALEAYRLTYEQFARHFQSLPTEPAVVERARSLAAELVRIAERFDFDVKPEVKAFLAAVQSGGAPLSMLTADVLEWLKSGDGMNSYRIRAADTQ